MWAVLGGLCGFALMLGALVWLAKNSGQKAAQLDACKKQVKQQAKEQERAYAIKNAVFHLPIAAVRKRLQDAKSK